MIVVDSSVWIDFIRGVSGRETLALKELFEDGQIVHLTGLIMVEVMRGSGSDEELKRVTNTFRKLPYLEFDSPKDHLSATRLYRSARTSGVTVSGVADLLIAASCIKYQAHLLHNDRDFDNLARVSDLKIWKSSEN